MKSAILLKTKFQFLETKCFYGFAKIQISRSISRDMKKTTVHHTITPNNCVQSGHVTIKQNR